MNKFSVKTVVAILVGAGLFFILGRFVSIPSGIPDTNISIQYGVLAFVAATFGPVAGLLSGLIGHFLIDFSVSLSTPGEIIWWNYIVASAFFGGAMGFVEPKLHIADGEFNKKEIFIFNIAQMVIHVVAWLVIAPILDMVMYGELADKAFVQGLTCAGIDILATAVVGTLLCVAYAAAKPQDESLE